MIVGVDFDGTLVVHSYPEIGEADHDMLRIIKHLKGSGHHLILITNREGKELLEAVEWCRVHGIEFDAVNDNLPHIQESWRINTRKIYCDLFIDDKAIHVDDFKRRWMDARMEE